MEALQRLLGGLSPDLPVAVFVVLHMPPTNVASLPPFSPGQLRSPWSTPVMERRS
ncbi:chemotaxis protein CheB [Dechloromonas hankyongensis]|uniref:chemotaxis protein CheB n=1 Tax=Dechloromonas hankyongensis TaxID=2908002 RepID=UPI003B84AAE9